MGRTSSENGPTNSSTQKLRRNIQNNQTETLKPHPDTWRRQIKTDMQSTKIVKTTLGATMKTTFDHL